MKSKESFLEFMLRINSIYYASANPDQAEINKERDQEILNNNNKNNNNENSKDKPRAKRRWKNLFD